MRFDIGQTVYTCRNSRGHAIKGEQPVTIVSHNDNMDTYVVKFRDNTHGVLDAKNLHATSLWAQSEDRERREYDRLRKKYGDS